MFKIIIQYLYVLNRIRKAKQQGYEGIRISNIYPINAEKLKQKGYKVIEPTFLLNCYRIRWVD